MTLRSKLLSSVAVATIAGLAMSTAALAGGSLKDEPAPAPEREFSWSVNIGGTSDYVFRGVSQSDEKAAIQGGLDVGYGIFYAGVWASRVDPDFLGGSGMEVDLYTGIKPVVGPVTFDLGVIYYAYPGQDKDVNGVDVDYVELKFGASMAPFENATIGGNLFYSPEYTFETGEVWTLEGSAGYTLPQVWIFTPTVSALVGYQLGDAQAYIDTFNADEYIYWNAGLSLAVDKLTLDVRYWDTDIQGTSFDGLADERVVFTAKVVLP